MPTIFYSGECKDDKTDEVIFDIQVLGEKTHPGEYAVLIYRFKPNKRDTLQLWINQIMEPVGEFKKLYITGIDSPPSHHEDFNNDADCWVIEWATKGRNFIIQDIKEPDAPES